VGHPLNGRKYPVMVICPRIVILSNVHTLIDKNILVGVTLVIYNLIYMYLIVLLVCLVTTKVTHLRRL